MAPKMNLKKNNSFLSAGILFALFTLTAIFSSGRWALPLAAWVSTVLGLRLIRLYKPLRGYGLLVLGSFIAAAIAWYGATMMSFIHPAAHFIFVFVMSLIGTAAYLLDRILTGWFQRDGRPAPFWTTLIFPLLVTGIEYFSMNGPSGSFGAGAYSQAGFLPLVQFSALTGIWGITFVSAWIASVINHAWERDFRRAEVRNGVLAAGLVLLVVLGYGWSRLWLAPAPETTVTVAGFTADPELVTGFGESISSGDEGLFRTNGAIAAQRYFERSLEAARQGAEIVVWPEVAVFGNPDGIQEVLAEGAELAAAEGIYLVIPAVTVYPEDTQPAVNAIYILDPVGEIALEHIKYGGNLFEGTQKGSGELQAIDTPYGKLSAVICWDADFPDVMRQAGQQSVDLMIVTAHDWYEVRDIHADMAVFRAVENGMALFRQTSNGVSLAADARGEVLSRVDQYEGGSEDGFTNVQLVELPLGAAGTQYPDLGDLVGQLSLLGAVAMIPAGVIARRRK